MSGYVRIKDFLVYPWSLSGIETNVVVQKGPMNIAFDIGYCTRPAVDCAYVFISHGHMDHIGNLFQHASKRDLKHLAPATYYVPSHLVNSLEIIAEQFATVSEKPHLKKLNIIGISAGDQVKLPWGRSIKVLKTEHRVPSQGYLIYHTKRIIKPEYGDIPKTEYGTLVKQGIELWNYEDYPEIAYLGDTLFDVFCNPENIDLLRVKLLITEATYLDHGNSIQKARDRGHTHLFEIYQEPDRFSNVESILLMHFSDRYTPREVQHWVYSILPKTLKGKVYIATTAQQFY